MLSAAGSALLVTALFYVPGLCWAWSLPVRRRGPRDAARAAGQALALGVPIVLLPAIVLAECGRFSLPALLLAPAAASLAGILFGRRTLRAALRAGWPGFVAVATLAAALFAWPQRGEWIVGGWDPGVNVNQGLLVSRTGSVRPPVDPVYARMAAQAPGVFTRETFSLTETFPGVPIDPATGALTPYFYRGTPTFVAILDRVAGPDAALRVNHVVGLFAAVMLLALLAQPFGTAAACAGLAAFALQPMFLHHLQVPASEMMELLCICALGLVLAAGRRARLAPLWLALLLVLALLSRVSFLLIGALGLILLVAGDAVIPRRRDVERTHLAWGAALALGLAWYRWIAPQSTAKIGHILPAMLLVAGAALAAALALDLCRRQWPPRRRGSTRVVWMTAVLLLASFVAHELTRHTPWREFPQNVAAWADYAGRPVLGVAAAGLALLAASRATRRGLAVWSAWLLVALAVVLLHKHVANLYPWATKRWLPLTPPLVALGVAALVDLSQRRFGGRGAAAALAVAALSLAPLVAPARAAWRATEYVGARDALAAVAREIGDGDVVLADHFRWGTPLALAFGKTVLNGERVWKAKDPRSAERAASFLDARRREGRRVLLLTSTGDGAAVFPPPFDTAHPLREWPELAMRELIHHRSARNFETRERKAVFRLYVWDALAPLPP